MSWRTTTAGLLTIVTLLAAPVKALIDGDPLTVPDWSLVVPGVMTALGLIFARDNKVTSEQAGATAGK